MLLSFTQCGVTVAALYLKAHMAQINGICVPQTSGIDKVGGEPTTSVVYFPRVLYVVKGLVPGYLVVVHSPGQLREHFMYRHFWSMVAVVKEGLDMMPGCDLYGMHMPSESIIRHRRTEKCDKNT